MQQEKRGRKGQRQETSVKIKIHHFDVLKNTQNLNSYFMACLPLHGYIANPSVIPFSQKREVTYRSFSQTGEKEDLVVLDAGRSRRKDWRS